MSLRIFLSQDAIDRGIESGVFSLDGDLLQFAFDPPCSLFINPSVHFVAVEGGASDPNQVLGTVKTSQELAQLGADHFEASVILGDHAYTVNQGFLATPVDSQGAPISIDESRQMDLLQTLRTLG